MGLAAALFLLALLMVVTLGLVSAVAAQVGFSHLGDAATQVWRGLRAVPPLALGAAPAGRLEASAIAVLLAAAAAVPCGLALAVLPVGLAWLGRTLLGVPAWLLLLVVLLATALLLAAPATALAEALQLIRRPFGLPGALALLWLPVFAARVERASRNVDPVRVRAHAGLGVGPLGWLSAIFLPAVARPLLGAAAVAFLVTAAALLVAGEAPGYDGPVTPADLMLVGVAGAAVAAPLTAWLARPR